MTAQEKFWYLIGPIVISVVFATTFPSVQVYFINLIEPKVLAFSNMVGTALSAVINWTIPKENMKRWYRRHFFLIVTVDIILTWCINFLGYSYPEVRFVGFAILNAVSTCLWIMIMKNVANRIIVDGDKRTDFDALIEYTTLLGNLTGATIAFFFVSFPVEYCLIANCTANMFMGITDYYIFKRLNKKYGLEL